ncbi:sigma-54-dependent transcriptional regulator [Desulfosediminicola flagellatus]|uniref:sigma-54-dependent transcriptional regulator n=1 Tax=Desulfosediminicola flagellatus TaxID=2569541 RepID=UPI0010AB8561|nr:sigma-54 dependent transcriptional regulator [Desulfosediminicola flagellatus]
MIRILLAEDDEIMRITIQDRLEKYNWHVEVATDGQNAIDMLDRFSFRIIISDVRMPNLDGMALLKHVREVTPYTDIIMMTGYGNVDSAINCLEMGAADYLLKPFDMDDLVIRINRILAVQNLKARNISLEDHCRQQQQQLIGSGPVMQEVYRLIEQAAPSDASILITGESGTGKELVAEAIHSASRRHKQPYIRLNCAAIPEGLMESEMFGHERGAFTGALKQKIGKFEMANGGTLLLDEIADLPLTLQPKLLRVLQEQELDRVGGSRTVKVDVRIICATAKDLGKEVEKGNFREDLYYRLRVIPIKLPPLRERKEDIPELTQHFLHSFSLKRGVAMNLTADAMERLLDYDFPGNVRELKNILERASVLAPEPSICPSDLPSDLNSSPIKVDEPYTLVLAEALARTEKAVILKALNKAGGVKQAAADLLGISRKNLWEKMKSHAIRA